MTTEQSKDAFAFSGMLLEKYPHEVRMEIIKEIRKVLERYNAEPAERSGYVRVFMEGQLNRTNSNQFYTGLSNDT